MARGFRYFGKKRGNRRTGSPTLASAGEALFFAVLLLLGCGGLILLFATVVVPEWRVNFEFVECPCKVMAKRIAERPGEGGMLYRPELKIDYEVDGVVYSYWHCDVYGLYSNQRDSAQAVLDQFALYDETRGNVYPCWYNPRDPREAVLVRESGRRWWVWLVFTVPISFVVIGAGGLIYSVFHWGKSAERRAALTQRVQDRELFATVGRGDRRHPFIPQGADVTNSPGTRLRYRLPVAGAGWAFVSTLVFCVLWNACVSVAVVWAVRGFLEGKPDWYLTILIVPFLVIGIGAIVFLVRRVLVATSIGATLVEISDHPLQPGMHYRVFVSQAGQLHVDLLCVSLVCEEWTTYRQGTNTRTETREVWRQELLRREAFQIQRGSSFESEFDLDVPADAMHSFMARHNQINWTLVVEGKVAKWPDFQRAFTAIIRPEQGDVAP